MKYRSIGVVVVVAAITATAMTGSASADGGGRIGGSPPELGVGLRVSIPGVAGSGRVTYGAHDRSAPRPIFERAIPATAPVGIGGVSNICQIGPVLPGAQLGNGWLFDIDVFLTATGRLLETVGTRCVPFTPGALGVPPPAPALPQPPNIAEIWNAVGLPTPPVGVSPAAEGITGLASWVWTNAAGPVGVAVDLAGYRVTGTARVIGYGVFPGEGGWVRSKVAGAPGDPAFAHVYERTGTYRLGVATLWTATAVMTGPGLAAPLTIDLGTALVTNARDYPVAQIRSRLLP